MNPDTKDGKYAKVIIFVILTVLAVGYYQVFMIAAEQGVLRSQATQALVLGVLVAVFSKPFSAFLYRKATKEKGGPEKLVIYFGEQGLLMLIRYNGILLTAMSLVAFFLMGT